MLREDQSPPNILNWTSADSMSFLANQIGLDADLDSHGLKFLVLIGYCVVAVLIRPECEWQIRNSWTVKLIRLVFCWALFGIVGFRIIEVSFSKKISIGQPIRIKLTFVEKTMKEENWKAYHFHFWVRPRCQGTAVGRDKIGV